MTEVRIRIGRLVVDQATLGDLSHAAYGERLQAEIARAVADGSSARLDPVAGAIVRVIRDTGVVR